MAITSPLDISWTHAYWVEGPEFLALYGGGGGGATGTGLKVGYMDLSAPGGIPDGTRIGTWPDEVGTLDATQATATDQPTYYQADASFNSKPYVDFPDSDRVGAPDNAVGLRTATFTAVNQPNEIVVIARQTAAVSGGAQFFWGLTGTSGQTHLIQANSSTTWAINDGSQGAATSATLDLNAHLFDSVWDYPTKVELFIDGTSRASFVPAFQHSLGRYSFGMDGVGANLYPHIVFVGVKLGAKLSSGDRTDLLAYARSYYGTP